MGDARAQTRLIGYWHKRYFKRHQPDFLQPVPHDENNVFSLHDAVAIDGPSVISFDFFDTLAFRRHHALSEVFEQTARNAALIVPGDPREAYRRVRGARGSLFQRLKAAKIAAGMGDEPCLNDALDRALVPMVNDPVHRRRLADRLVMMEAEFERQNLVLNDEAIPALRAIRAGGRKAIITSDMYLPQAAMQHIVDGLGLTPYIDHLIVSAQMGVTKHSGDLYPHLIKIAEVEASQILHLGDNWHSDVVQAKAHGLMARHYMNAKAEANARALVFRAQNESATLDSQRRTKAYRMPKAAAPLDHIIDQLIGPACGLFALDILAAAERRDASHVFFMTRDGTIFRDICTQIRAQFPTLFGARAAFSTLATSRASGEALRTVDVRPHDLIGAVTYLLERPFSIAGLFELFDLTMADFKSCPPAQREALNAAFDTVDTQPFLSLMAEKPAFRTALTQALARRRAPIIGYLEHQKLFDATNPVMVDIGYSGTWAKQLSAYLDRREQINSPLPNMQFRFLASNHHCDRNLDALHPGVDLCPGFLLDHHDTQCARASLNFAWLEPFLLDPELGVLRGYDAGAPFAPIFDAAGHDPDTFATLQKRRARVIAQAVLFVGKYIEFGGDLLDLRDQKRKEVIRLITNPTHKEVRALNQLSHQRGMKSVKAQELARRFYPNRISAKIRDIRDQDHWVQGSLKRSHLGVLNRVLARHPAQDYKTFRKT